MPSEQSVHGLVQAGPGVGIAPDAVGRLADALHTSVSSAGAIRQAILTIAERAAAVQIGAVQIGAVGGKAAAITGRPGPALPGGDGDPDGGGLRALMQQAPPVAKEIHARLSHFLACERDSALYCAPGLVNLPIDRSLWFTDERVPDPQKVKDAIAFFNAHIGDSGGLLGFDAAKGTQEVLGNWKQLTPAELDALLNLLTGDQLGQLNGQLVGQLGEGASWWGAGSTDHAVQDAFTNLILRSAAPGTAARIQKQLTVLKLTPDTEDFGGSKYTWVPLTAPLVGAHGLDPDHAYKQIFGPDCFFAAPLLAIAYKDQDFIKSKIWPNDNGTYTVRLYQGGQPVDVSVSDAIPDLGMASKQLWNELWKKFNTPTDHALLKTMFSPKAAAIDNPNRIFSDGTWAVLYEKAFAQLNGGYLFGNGAGGYLRMAVSTITGQESSDMAWNPGSGPSLASIQEKLQQGHIMVVETHFNQPGGADQRDRKGEKITDDHAYSVRSVYTDPATKQQMIELVNPLGPPSADNPYAQYLHLTEKEFQKYCKEMDYFLPPKG